MLQVVHHIALAIAVLALGDAGLRLASRLSPGGLERLVAAVVLAVAAAVAQALALGLVGLGASPVALCAAAAATWAAARRALPEPATTLRSELAAWWAARGAGGRVAAAALAGGGVAWLIWQLVFPSIGFDSALYHYGLVAGWVDNGRPGSELILSYDIPYASYPLTDEVALTWGTGIARSWVPIALWNPLLLILLALASHHTLRRLGATVSAAALAVAALLACPLIVRQLNEGQNDLPALAWLACVTALVCGAARRPGLLVPAVLAAGLAIGTKTTTAPLALAALAVGGYQARGRLRPLAVPLALAAAGAFVLGGLWYARNLVEHGSPLWPFAPGPFGDPAPRFLGAIDATFAQHPRATLEGRLDRYAERAGGAWLALAVAGALLPVALAGRRLLAPGLRRALLVTGSLTAFAVLAWTMAWGTGVQTTTEVADRDIWSLSATRYLLPAMASAVLTVALATRGPRPLAVAATAALGGALVWSLAIDLDLGAPYTPPLTTPLLGAAAGVALLALSRVRLGARAPAPPVRAALAAGVLAAGVLGAVVADGYLERYTRVSASTAFGRDVVAWHLRTPGFEDGERPVAFGSRAVLAQLAGERFTHPLSLVPQRATCAAIDALATRATVVVTDFSYWGGILGVEPYTAPACAAKRTPAYRDFAYTVLATDLRSAPITRTSGSGTMNCPPPSRYSRSRSTNSSRKCQGSTR